MLEAFNINQIKPKFFVLIFFLGHFSHLRPPPTQQSHNSVQPNYIVSHH